MSVHTLGWAPTYIHYKHTNIHTYLHTYITLEKRWGLTHPAERYHVEGVTPSVNLVEEVVVGAVRGVIHLQLIA